MSMVSLDEVILNWGPNLLTGKHANSAIFSECALKSLKNRSDFDSAILRFESWRPSQQVIDFARFSIRTRNLREYGASATCGLSPCRE